MTAHFLNQDYKNAFFDLIDHIINDLHEDKAEFDIWADSSYPEERGDTYNRNVPCDGCPFIDTCKLYDKMWEAMFPEVMERRTK
jgi:hypothetical protein